MTWYVVLDGDSNVVAGTQVIRPFAEWHRAHIVKPECIPDHLLALLADDEQF
jgi:hypothetical protein